MAKEPNAVPLPIVLKDDEEVLLAYGFNLALEFRAGFSAVLKSVNYAVVKDFCQRYELESLDVLALYKQMCAEMES